jgi:hypothetical protein
MRVELRKIQGGDAVGLVAWEKVREVAGDLMEALDMYAKRFKVGMFPTPEQLAQLIP